IAITLPKTVKPAIHMDSTRLTRNGSAGLRITDSFGTLSTSDSTNFVDFSRWHTATIVKKIHELPTPCLVLDLDGFSANLEKMSRHSRDRNVALRPHAKTHKCVNVARKQLEKGAVGVCVATIAEAEVMLHGGIRQLIITSETVGEPKISRLTQ